MYDFRLAQVLHEERVREAEKWWSERPYLEPAPSFRQRLLQRFGDHLLALGGKLKALSAAQASQGTPVRSHNG